MYVDCQLYSCPESCKHGVLGPQVNLRAPAAHLLTGEHELSWLWYKLTMHIKNLEITRHYSNISYCLESLSKNNF